MHSNQSANETPIAQRVNWRDGYRCRIARRLFKRHCRYHQRAWRFPALDRASIGSAHAFHTPIRATGDAPLEHRRCTQHQIPSSENSSRGSRLVYTLQNHCQFTSAACHSQCCKYAASRFPRLFVIPNCVSHADILASIRASTSSHSRRNTNPRIVPYCGCPHCVACSYAHA